MLCYDCVQQNRRNVTGIAICTRCGLATCQEHSRVLPAAVQRANHLGFSNRPVAARRAVCNTCYAAETSY